MSRNISTSVLALRSNAREKEPLGNRCTCKRRKRRKRMVSKCGISIPFSLGYPHINGGAPSSSFGQSKQGNPGTVSLISRELQSVFTWLIILLHSHNF
ncbi:hypothetical protein HBI47_152750 [Parastagonospora nodorum]|nr:hypothetical protein HBI47_152750 [Parastagonospora nodorum]